MKRIMVDHIIYSVAEEIGEMIILQNEKNYFLYAQRWGVFASIKRYTRPPHRIRKINGSFTFQGLNFKIKGYHFDKRGKQVAFQVRTVKGLVNGYFILDENSNLERVTFPIVG